MTSISSLSTSTQSTYRLSLDTNGDGFVSADELAAAKTSGSSSSTSTSSKSTSSSSDDSDSSSELLSKLTSLIMSMLLQMGSGTDASGKDASGQDASGDGSQPAPLSVSALDTDGDGAVSATEFAAAKPDDVSDDMSAELFSQLDADGSGSLDDSELSAVDKGAPPPPPPAAAASEESDQTDLAADLDTFMQQIQAIAKQYLDNAASDSTQTASQTASL